LDSVLRQVLSNGAACFPAAGGRALSIASTGMVLRIL
jgi:hypothetical protein